MKVVYDLGVKKILVLFAVFSAIGFCINTFVPSELIVKYLGAGNIFAVPLLSIIGLPLYLSDASAIPMINTLIEGGASQGALLAFMITGLGTSAGVLTGLLVVMKKKAIVLYASFLLFFALVIGYLYDFILFAF